MPKLVIKSTESFKKANKKTSAVALLAERPNLNDNQKPSKSEKPLVSEKEMIKTLYGDIPDKYRFKKYEETEGESELKL